MTKGLILAFFLSQAAILDVRTIHEPAQLVEYDHDPLYTRRVNTLHIRRTPDRDPWTTQGSPVPYWFYWTCEFPGQTAQQCIAIYSVLEQELRELDQSPLVDELRAIKRRIERKRILDLVR